MGKTNDILDNILSWANNETNANNQFEAGIEYAKKIILAMAEKKNLDYTTCEHCNQIIIIENGKINCPFCNNNELETNIPTGMQFLTYVLEDDSTEFGGTSFDGQTLNDFLSEIGMTPDAPMNEINESLIECGIKPIKY
jgi:hypothetical protein